VFSIVSISGPASAVACPRCKPKGRRASLCAFPNAGLLTPREGNAVARVCKRIWTTKTGERIARVADYFAPRPDTVRRGDAQGPSQPKREASAWLAHTVVEIKRAVHTPAHRSPTVAVAGEAWIRQAETDRLELSSQRVDAWANASVPEPLALRRRCPKGDGGANRTVCLRTPCGHCRGRLCLSPLRH
jgi:hypothetical protein